MGKVEKKRSRKGMQKPASCKEPEQCPHVHFRHDVPDRRGIARDKLFNILATPKGYCWEEPKKEKGDGEKPAKKTPVTPRRAHCKKHTRKYDRAYVHNFLAEVWAFLGPEMADRLKTMLMNEFSMSEEDAKNFISKQREANIVNSSTVSYYKKPRDVGDQMTVLDSVIKLRTPNKTYCDKFPKSNIGIRNSWIKDLSDLISEKMTDYVLDTMTANRTERQQEIAQTILNRFNTTLEQRASLSKPKTQTHKAMVLVADRLSLWLDKNVQMSKDNAERLKEIEEAEEEKKKGGDWKKRLEEKRKRKEPKQKPGAMDEGGALGPDGKPIVGADGKPVAGADGKPTTTVDGQPAIGADGKPIVDEPPKAGVLGAGDQDADLGLPNISGITVSPTGISEGAEGESEEEEEEIGGESEEEGSKPGEPSGGDGGAVQPGEEAPPQPGEPGGEDGQPAPKPEGGEDVPAEEVKTPEDAATEDGKPAEEPTGESQAAGEGAQGGEEEGAGPQSASQDEAPKTGEEEAPDGEAVDAKQQPPEGDQGGEEGGSSPGAQEPESSSKDESGKGGDDAPPSETEDGTPPTAKTITSSEEPTEGKDESGKTDDGPPSETVPPSGASEAGGESELEEEALPSSETPQLTPGYTTEDEDTTKPSDELPSSVTQPTTSDSIPKEGEGDRSTEPTSKTDDSYVSAEGPSKQISKASVPGTLKKDGSKPGLEAGGPGEPSRPEQMRERELIRSIAELIIETPIEDSPRQESIKDVLGKQLEKAVGDESRHITERVASKVATWMDKMVDQVETEYGDRSRRSVDRVGSGPHAGVVGIPRLPPVSQKPKGSIFVVKKIDDRGYDVDLISNNQAQEKIRMARGMPLSRVEVPNPDAALEPSDVKSWVEWASAVSEMAQSWAEWIEDTVQEAQKRGEMLQTDDSPEKLKEWEAFRGKKAHGAQQWRKTKKEVERSAELWNRKGMKTRQLEKTAKP